jgi:hypothetical protein
MVVIIKKIIQITDTVACQDDKAKPRIVHDVQSHAGLDFMPLLHRNQNISSLLCSRKDCGWPRSVVRKIKDARDSKVDELIKTFMKQRDPMGEERINLDDKSRATVYHEAEVPMAIELSMPAFEAKDKTQIEATKVFVLTSSKRNDKVLIEISTPTLTWLKHMCINADEDEGGDPSDEEEDDNQMLELLNSWAPDKIKVVQSKRQQKRNVAYMYTVVYHHQQGAKGCVCRETSSFLLMQSMTSSSFCSRMQSSTSVARLRSRLPVMIIMRVRTS